MKIIQRMNEHFMTLETIAIERDVAKVLEYIGSNDFRCDIFLMGDKDNASAYAVLTKSYSDDDYICISTLDKTIFAVSHDAVVCRKDISTNLEQVLDVTVCWGAACSPYASQREKSQIKRILNNVCVPLED